MSGKIVRVTAYTSERPLDPVLDIEPTWPGSALVGDPRFVMSVDFGYGVWDADFDVEEFRALLEERTRTANARPTWHRLMDKDVRAIKAALAGDLGPVSRFHIQICEWESGLDLD